MFPKAGLRACFFWCLVGTASHVLAQSTAVSQFAAGQTLSAVGYTGLGLTPTFRPADWGEIAASYQNTIPGDPKPKGYNYLISVGLLPGVEINGRLATQNLWCNMYGWGDDPCKGHQVRDLAASFKLGHSVVLSNGWRVGASVGTTDYGGAATMNRSTYGVGGVDAGTWSLAWGYGNAVTAYSPLKGAFIQAAWRPLDELQVYSEWLDHRGYVGLQAFLPPRFSSENTRFYVGALRQIHGVPGVIQKQALSAGVSIQFEKPQSAKAPIKAWAPEPLVQWGVSASEYLGLNNRLPRADGPRNDTDAVIARSEATKQSPPPTPLRDPQSLATTLAEAGFEDISIGQTTTTPSRWIIRFENSAYNWNDLDGVGAAVAKLLKHTQQDASNIELQLTRRGIVTFRLVSNTACLRQWLAQSPCSSDQAVQLFAGASVRASVPTFPSDDQISWVVKGERASIGRSRLYITPAVDARVGTEFGTYDSSWGVNFSLQTPLWKGANTDVAYIRAAGNSRNYQPGGLFSDWLIRDEMYRVLIHQAVDLGYGITARAAAGRFAKVLDGADLEVRWQPADGAHRVSFEAAEFKHRFVDFKKTFYLGTYRYFSDLLQTDFEFKGGQFWQGDKGTLAVMRHWFGDISFAVYARRTGFPAGSPAMFAPFGNANVTVAGAEISFPLTPRKEYQGKWLQLRGDDRFSYGIYTVVGKESNWLVPYYGNFAPIPMSLDGTVFNFDRMSDRYVQSNLQRIRQAAEKFAE